MSREVEAWIRGRAGPGRASEIVVFHDRPWGTVRRVPVDGGFVWFKECAAAQAFEPRLTAALAARWPDRLPEVLAHDAERSWLLLGDAGKPLGFDAPLEPWLSILPLYAELQRGEAPHAGEHLEGGVPDRRLAAFPALYESVLRRELPLDRNDVKRLRAFEPEFIELCTALAAGGIAATVQHDDLHGANVYTAESTWRIVDWGDSCISHPFMTAFVAFHHLEKFGGLQRDGAWFGRLRDAYLEPWGQPSDLRATFELALRLGAFAHLFKELHVFDAIPLSERPKYGPPLPEILAACLAEAGRSSLEA